MRNVLRGSFVLSLSVLLCFLVLRPGSAVPQDESGPACGMEPEDADQVALVRAMADEQCDCATAANHGAYVSCVDAVAGAAVADGSLRPECEDTVISCAAQSTCGRPGFVTCCTTDSTGQATCSTKSTAALCKAP